MAYSQARDDKPRQPLFRLFGFEIKMDASWILLALLITWTLAVGLFPYNYPDLARPTYWWMGLASAAGIFFSIVFHELSHSLVARRFGMPIKGITLFIFGGVAEMDDEPPSPKSEFLMALAGPVSSYVLAGMLFALARLLQAADWPTAIVGVLAYLSFLNTIVATFNLVPAFPLDGGRMLRAGLWKWKKTLPRATHIASRIGSGFAWILMILGVVTFVQGNFLGGTWWFLIGLFLRGAALSSYRQVMIRDALQGEPISRLMTPNPITVTPSLTVNQLVYDHIYERHLKMFPVVENGRLLGSVTSHDVSRIPRDQWPRQHVRDIMQPVSADTCVAPDSDTARILSRMTRPGAPGRLMVVGDGDRLLGVISFSDLKSFISLKLDLEPSRR